MYSSSNGGRRRSLLVVGIGLLLPSATAFLLPSSVVVGPTISPSPSSSYPISRPLHPSSCLLHATPKGDEGRGASSSSSYYHPDPELPPTAEDISSKLQYWSPSEGQSKAQAIDSLLELAYGYRGHLTLQHITILLKR